MNYELAKQLKDAGFPQTKPLLYDYTNKDVYHVPTLSELIEACIDEKDPAWFDLHFFGDTKTWQADSGAYKSRYEILAPTPEEAVARLYLSLNPPK